jgi:fused signal recognition particle receptor
MFSFKKKSATESTPDSEKKGFLKNLSSGLAKTRKGLVEGLTSLVKGKKSLDADSLEDIENLLISADIGIEATGLLVKGITRRLDRNELQDGEAIYTGLHDEMVALLDPVLKPLVLPETADKPFVILMVGVNGAGKTTTIAKLAHRFQQQGKTVMLAAADTFRAAAIEQLQSWGERHKVTVIAQKHGSDPASVAYDALHSAIARKIDVLLIDTAGRLHTQSNLMEELKKIKRVLGKTDAEYPQETMLVLDAGTGQNALSQAKQFHQAVALTGMTLTKLDGTAKGGIIFSLAQQLNIPIHFIGVGEQPEDLQPFSANEFVDALLERN